MSYTVLVDTSAIGYNEQAMREIENENRRNASAAYNGNTQISDATRSRYIEQEGRRIEAIIKKYAVRAVKAVDFGNELATWAYLDKDGKLVCENQGTHPEYGLEESQ